MTKTEGTIILDGIIEGPLVDARQEDRLREWVRTVADKGLVLSLDIEGGNFSILADAQPMMIDSLKGEPVGLVVEALEALMEIVPAPGQQKVFSTLRSMEYRKDLEVQTLYAAAPGGKIVTHERVVEARTMPPQRCIPNQQRLRSVGMGVLIALGAVIVGGFFVDYREILRDVILSVRSPKAEDIVVDTGSFSPFIEVGDKRVVRNGRKLILTLRRGEMYPLTLAELDRLSQAGGVMRRLTIDAIARGYIRCEVFDGRKEYAGFSFHRIAELREKEAIDIHLDISAAKGVTRVTLSN